jgi:hypothetical protein
MIIIIIIIAAVIIIQQSGMYPAEVVALTFRHCFTVIFLLQLLMLSVGVVTRTYFEPKLFLLTIFYSCAS